MDKKREHVQSLYTVVCICIWIIFVYHLEGHPCPPFLFTHYKIVLFLTTDKFRKIITRIKARKERFRAYY